MVFLFCIQKLSGRYNALFFYTYILFEDNVKKKSNININKGTLETGYFRMIYLYLCDMSCENKRKLNKILFEFEALVFCVCCCMYCTIYTKE